MTPNHRQKQHKVSLMMSQNAATKHHGIKCRAGHNAWSPVCKWKDPCVPWCRTVLLWWIFRTKSKDWGRPQWVPSWNTTLPPSVSSGGPCPPLIPSWGLEDWLWSNRCVRTVRWQLATRVYKTSISRWWAVHTHTLQGEASCEHSRRPGLHGPESVWSDQEQPATVSPGQASP